MSCQHIILLCFLVVLEYISGQKVRFEDSDERSNFIDDQLCPYGYECVRQSRCLPSRKTIPNTLGRPRTCGFAYGWYVCCGRRIRRVDSTHMIRTTMRKSAPTTQKTSIRPIVTSPRSSASTAENRDTECGKVNPSLQGMVIGGVDAKQGAWPWMVAITKKVSNGNQLPHCTGFLIDRRHVLSAAHCFNNQNRTYSTRIGHVDMNLGQEYSVIRLTVHPGYEKGSSYDDIALVTLDRDVEVPDFRPICLPWSSEFKNITGMGTTIVGWGSTEVDGQLSSNLKQLHGIPIISNYWCNQAFQDRIYTFLLSIHRGLTPGFICAEFMEEWGKDTCQGVSNGPLMFRIRDQWYAVGIVSFGYTCRQPELPGGYTRVSEYLPWIESNRKDILEDVC